MNHRFGQAQRTDRPSCRHSAASCRSLGLPSSASDGLRAYDAEWFAKFEFDGDGPAHSEPRKLMRTCRFSFTCDCSPEKLLPFFRTLTEEGLSELYGADQELAIVCPRCGRKFRVSRDEIRPPH